MKVNAYNPANGSLLAAGITGVSFGNVKAGHHCDTPVVIKVEKTTENSFSDMKMFLQNNGGLNYSKFGYFTSDGFVKNVDYTYMTGTLFELATGVTGVDYTGASGVDIKITEGQPVGYVWLDIQPGPYEVGSTSSINYRFVFDYT